MSTLADRPSSRVPVSARWGAPRPPTHLPPRVLLAEDDEDMRELLATTLRKDGYEVVEVCDGGRLLVRVATAYVAGCAHEAYDLLLSDIRMPVCSGLQILEQLRSAHWPTPAILMTAFGDIATRARAEALGATLLDKPLRVADLRATVQALVPFVPTLVGTGAPAELVKE